MKNLHIILITLFVSTLSFNIVNATSTEASFRNCTVETLGGTHQVDYTEYYIQLAEFYVGYSRPSGNDHLDEISKQSSIEAAGHWIESCPEFFEKINQDILPHEQGSGHWLDDAIREGLSAVGFGSEIEEIHPELKRWLNRIK